MNAPLGKGVVGIDVGGTFTDLFFSRDGTGVDRERKDARCALITTRSFRDILELGRRDRQRMYGLTGT